MDAIVKNANEVENIDDEVYYREMLGCKVEMQGASCADIDCGQGIERVCERPGRVYEEIPEFDPFGGC